MSGKKTIGKSIDEIADRVSEKAEKAKDNIAAAEKNIAGIALDISKSVKKAAEESNRAVSGLLNKKKK